MRIYDLSDPASPVEISSIPVSGSDLAIAGDLAYVAGQGLVIVDISDDTAPLVLGSLATPRAAVEVALSGDRAYLAISSLVVIVDVPDPAAPFGLGEIDPPGQVDAVEAAGDLVYLGVDAFQESGLLVVDASDPAAPVEVGRNFEIVGLPTDIELVGSLAYVSTRDFGGLGIFDVSDPTAPRLVGRTELPRSIADVEVTGG